MMVTKIISAEVQTNLHISNFLWPVFTFKIIPSQFPVYFIGEPGKIRDIIRRKGEVLPAKMEV